MDHFLAKGKVIIGKKLNYLLVHDGQSNTIKTVAYNISYDIERLLIEKYLNKDVIINLNVKELR